MPAPEMFTVETPAEERFDERPSGLRGMVARGTIINAAFLVGLDSLSLLRTFVVAGFLTTADYGVWGILLISIGTLGMLKEGLVGDKYVQQDEADQEKAFQQAFTLEAILNGALMALALVALPLFALLYGQSEILLPGLVLTLAIPMATFQSPLWIYYRRLRFLEQRRLQAVEPLVAFVLIIGLAAAGLGYWSLVIGTVAGKAAGAAAAARFSPYRLAWRFERGAVREYTSFVGPLFTASVSRLVGVQVLFLVGEAKLGLAGAGVITLANTIRTYGDRVDNIVTQTLYPAVCAVKDRTELLFEAFTKSNRLGLMWGMPFGVGLALFAEDLVEFGIGEEWRSAVGLLQAFGLIAAFNHIGYNWTAFFRARGDTKPLAVQGIVGVVTMLAIATPLLYSDGLDGLAVGLGIATAIALALRTWYLTRLFPAFQILTHSARAMAPTIPAAAAVLGLRALTDVDRTAALALGELALFGVICAVTTYLLERRLLHEVVGYLRGAPLAAPAA